MIADFGRTFCESKNRLQDKGLLESINEAHAIRLGQTTCPASS